MKCYSFVDDPHTNCICRLRANSYFVLLRTKFVPSAQIIEIVWIKQTFYDILDKQRSYRTIQTNKTNKNWTIKSTEFKSKVIPRQGRWMDQRRLKRGFQRNSRFRLPCSDPQGNCSRNPDLRDGRGAPGAFHMVRNRGSWGIPHDMDWRGNWGETHRQEAYFPFALGSYSFLRTWQREALKGSERPIWHWTGCE
jgi:hypothetical protein